MLGAGEKTPSLILPLGGEETRATLHPLSDPLLSPPPGGEETRGIDCDAVAAGGGFVAELFEVGLGDIGNAPDWAVFLARLLFLGPAIGVAIGGAGASMLALADSRVGVRREYQALFGVGLVLAAYAAATAAGGDGFLSAFAAGLAVVLSNKTLCDCFLEYGEITSEMAMLLAFVLFGAVLSGSLGSVNLAESLVLAALVIFVIRPSVLGLVLVRARMSWEAHAFVSWFGPRGLNSLLLALLVVQAGVPGAELLMAVVGVVVLASVTLHGASAGPVTAWYGRRAARETLEEERESTADGLFSHREVDVPLVSPEELHRLVSTGNPPPMILDVRTRSSYERDGAQIPRSVRVLPDQVADWAGGLGRRSAQTPTRGHLLHLKQRGDQRPCGAATEGQGHRRRGAGGRIQGMADEVRRGAKHGSRLMEVPPTMSRVWDQAASLAL